MNTNNRFVFSNEGKELSVEIGDSCSSLHYNSVIEYVHIEYGINSINSYDFKNCEKLKKVVLPDTIQEIESGAFYGCTELRSINLPESIRVIEPRTFKGCESLEYIVIPDSVEFIRNEAFQGCKSLRTVYLPSSVKHIGYEAFKDCTALKAVEGGNGLIEIRGHAFDGCTSLTSFPFSSSIYSISYDAFMNSGISIPKDIITYCSDISSRGITIREREAIIPDGVFSIIPGSLECPYFRGWANVVLPDSVKNISKYAFTSFKFNTYYADLKSVLISTQAIKESLPARMNMPANYFRQLEPFDYEMAFILADTVWKDFVTDLDFINIIWNHNDEYAQSEARKRLNHNVSKNLRHMLLKSDYIHTAKRLENIALYAATYIDRLDMSDIFLLIRTAKNHRAYTAIDIIENHRIAFEHMLPEDLFDCMGEDGIEPFTAELFFPLPHDYNYNCSHICWKNSGEYVDEHVIQGILYAYMKQTDDFHRIEKADRIVRELEPENFANLINDMADAFMVQLRLTTKILYNMGNGIFPDSRLLPVFRYGNDEIISNTVNELTELYENYPKMIKLLIELLELSDTDQAYVLREKLSYQLPALLSALNDYLGYSAYVLEDYEEYDEDYTEYESSDVDTDMVVDPDLVVDTELIDIPDDWDDEFDDMYS